MVKDNLENLLIDGTHCMGKPGEQVERAVQLWLLLEVRIEVYIGVKSNLVLVPADALPHVMKGLLQHR